MPDPGFSEQSQRRERSSPPATELLPNPNRRQKRILEKLGSIEQISERLYGHLRDVFRGGDLSPNSTPEEEERYLAGELAELLVIAEVGLYPVFHHSSEIVNLSTTKNSQTNELLLGVLHNPEVIGLGIQTGRNPDLVIIDTDSGTIRAVGEVKLGSLNRRALKQLEPTGFEQNIRKILTLLNQDLDKGKEVFGVDEKGEVVQGRVADNFFEMVFVPSDTKTAKSEWGGLFKPKGSGRKNLLNPKEIEAFKRLLKTGKVKLIPFSFSRAEIKVMASHLIKEVEELEKKYHPESV